MKEEWKAAAKIEDVLYSTSRLTTICQHEQKLNTAHGPFMIKITNDYSSSGSLEEIDVDTWSKNKNLTHPKINDSDADDFNIIGKTCLTTKLLKTERSFFGNSEEITFA